MFLPRIVFIVYQKNYTQKTTWSIYFISVSFCSVNVWLHFSPFFLTFLSHLFLPSPCAEPASIWVIQCFLYCVSWNFFMSPLILSLHLFFGRPLVLLPETSSLSDFAQMWVGSRLKQWPNHFSLLFSRKVSTGFTCASFLMSSFLRWSNLVFPLVHLSILISTEFSLFSSFFFTAQHSEPYVAAFLSLHNNLYVHISCQKNIGSRTTSQLDIFCFESSSSLCKLIVVIYIMSLVVSFCRKFNYLFRDHHL